MSFPPFDVSVQNKSVRSQNSAKILSVDINDSDSMELQNIVLSEPLLNKKTKPRPPVSMASISESFYKTTAPKRRKDFTDDLNNASPRGRPPIRMQATRRARAVDRGDFESDFEDAGLQDLSYDGEISRYASLTLVFLAFLVIVGYMLIRFVRHAPPDVWGGEARARKVTGVTYTSPPASGAVTTESITSVDIEPVF